MLLFRATYNKCIKPKLAKITTGRYDSKEGDFAKIGANSHYSACIEDCLRRFFFGGGGR